MFNYNTKKNVSDLRKLMRKNSIDSYFVTHNDEYFSEYVPKNKERLKWISGFSGSAGSLLITAKKLYLFTDGRYLLQAKQQTLNLKCEIINILDIKPIDFLKKNYKSFKSIGIDSRTFSLVEFNYLKKVITKTNIKIKILDKNLIDILWKRNLKVQNTNKIFFLSSKYTGETNKIKLKKIFSYLLKEEADYIFTQDSESIAWLNNLRGNDLDHTPITFCSALIGKNDQKLFFENKNLPEKIKKKLGKETKVYNSNELYEIVKKKISKNSKVIINENKISLFNYNLLKKITNNLLSKNDVMLSYRSIKNVTEIKCFKKAHILDGIAICKFLYWYKNYKGTVSELDVVKKIDSLRYKNSDFICASFPTIAGAGKNGAIIHYQPNSSTNRKISGSDILLLDSGGQYFYGTTDVTRTITRSDKISNTIKYHYTAVLKGHISLNLSQFPSGSPGSFLDTLARQKLWDIGEDFAHSTGHGVGFCLNVHEGPFSISLKSTSPIYGRMVFSNEPGLYKNGKYGIRIENLVYTKDLKINNKNFLTLENLTLVPYEKDLIKVNHLNTEEKKWLNNYHKSVIRNISPYLDKKELKWLEKQCKEI